MSVDVCMVEMRYSGRWWMMTCLPRRRCTLDHGVVVVEVVVDALLDQTKACQSLMYLVLLDVAAVIQML